MKNRTYLSHRSEDGREEEVVTHLRETALLASKFAERFDSKSQGELVGLLHDIGKFSDAFQKRINGSTLRVDHSTAGAVECCKKKQMFAALAIAGHHSGLPDMGGQCDSVDGSSFCARMNRAQKGMLESYDVWKDFITFPEALLPEFDKADLNIQKLEAMFYTRMLFSCLVDADFLATEAFMNGKKRADTGIPMQELCERFDKYVSKFFPPKSDINLNRCKILQHCRQMGLKQGRGLFTLTVPTGGGKTLASLGFALNNAVKNNLKRIVYVIPYTSIIEQTAEIFRNVLGDDVVLEHHSNVVYDIDKEDQLFYDMHDEKAQKEQRLKQATENWDMPVIVTTAVQFFESLYANKSSKCRKLHNLAESVIIFDEAQMLPVPYLCPCVFSIAQLVKRYKISAVLCSATQPALEGIFKEKFNLPSVEPVELCPKSVYDPNIFKRVKFVKAGSVSLNNLIEELNEHEQVLCIVNSRKGAQDIFEGLNEDGRFHLSTFMFPAHRQRVLHEIRSRLKNNFPCRVVSTSLIEAGVDVDFPTVYREEAGLDSILQSAGRCNRECRRLRENSLVTVFKSDDLKSPNILDMNIGVGRSVLQKYDDVDSEEAIKSYFKKLLMLKGKALDKNNIVDSMGSKYFMFFASIADNFHIIDSPTRTVYIPLGEGEELTSRLREGERSRSLFRKLGRYGVSIYKYQFEKLENAGALEILDDGICGPVVLTDTSLYSEEKGLAFDVKDNSGALFL